MNRMKDLMCKVVVSASLRAKRSEAKQSFRVSRLLRANTALAMTGLFFSFLLAGCGYSTGSLLPSKFRTISVEPFKNKVSYAQSRSSTYIPLLEVKARDAIASRFLFDGHLRIGDSETADLILRGELIGLERQELRLTDNQDVQEFRVNIIVDLTLWDPVEQKEVWHEPSFAGEATYFVSGPLAKSESVAVAEALDDLARRAVERTLEDW